MVFKVQSYWCRFDDFIIDFQDMSHIALVFL